MTRKLATFLMIALTMFASTAMVMPSASAQSANPHGGLIVPIAQTIPTTTTIPSTLAGATSIVGTYNITGFQVINGVLNAVGTLTVNVLNAAGGVLQTVTQAGLAIPVAQSATTQSSCTILTLDTGQITLDLLGLVVNLAPIHLNITAQSGAGNLLGNLLCSVANLLNNGGPVTQIANLLNQILSQL